MIWAEYRRLLQQYFGLRVLITDRSEWTTAQIVEAYRGQSRVEAAFRDLKDPGMLSTRPQFHWTDQKLQVHAFMCVTAYLLVRLLWWRARRDAGFGGSARNLLAQLTRIRRCRIVEHTGRAGRPGSETDRRTRRRPGKPGPAPARPSASDLSLVVYTGRAAIIC